MPTKRLRVADDLTRPVGSALLLSAVFVFAATGVVAPPPNAVVWMPPPLLPLPPPTTMEEVGKTFWEEEKAGTEWVIWAEDVKTGMDVSPPPAGGSVQILPVSQQPGIPSTTSQYSLPEKCTYLMAIHSSMS